MHPFIDVDERYQQLSTYRAGHLPVRRTRLHAWHARIGKAAKPLPVERLQPSVAAMAALIESDGIVRMYADKMLREQKLLQDVSGNAIPASSIIKSIPDMLARLNHIVTYAPWFSDPSHFPMSALFVYVMMTPSGEDLFRNAAFNESLRGVLQAWCEYLDSPASLSVITPRVRKGAVGWLSPQAYGGGKNGMRLWEFQIPDFGDRKHWGFSSYNDYFHRNILSVVTSDQEPPRRLPIQRKFWHKHTKVGDVPRPLAGADDDRVIVSANDGTVWRIAQGVEASDRFWLKSQPYSLTNMLHNLHVPRFVGGSVFQAFLSGANFHRWHAPISGKVVHAEVIGGLMFSELLNQGIDLSAGTKSQGYEANVNTRALVFIESPHESIGMVCVIPIGITEISSITVTVTAGQTVNKGDELGFFSYGGSTLALVFQPNAIETFTVAEGDAIDVNAQIATAAGQIE